MKIKAANTTLGPHGAHPAILFAMEVVDWSIRRHTGRHMRVTGLAEEGHSEKSRHYGTPSDPRCQAFDFDADDQAMTAMQRALIEKDIITMLPDIFFDFLWEGLGTPKAHGHVEWDPTM